MAFPPGKQAPPFVGGAIGSADGGAVSGAKEVGTKGRARKPGKSAPAQKALRLAGPRPLGAPGR